MDGHRYPQNLPVDPRRRASPRVATRPAIEGHDGRYASVLSGETGRNGTRAQYGLDKAREVGRKHDNGICKGHRMRREAPGTRWLAVELGAGFLDQAAIGAPLPCRQWAEAERAHEGVPGILLRLGRQEPVPYDSSH